MLKNLHFCLFFAFLLTANQQISAQNNVKINVLNGDFTRCTNNADSILKIEIVPNPTLTWKEIILDWGEGLPIKLLPGNNLKLTYTYSVATMKKTCAYPFLTDGFQKKIFVDVNYTSGVSENVGIKITFKNAPVANFSVSPPKPCVDQTVLLTNATCPNNDPSMKYKWLIDNVLKDTTINYSLKFLLAKSFNITLETKNICGSSITSQTVQSYEKPIAIIKADSGFVTPLTNPLKICLGDGGVVKLDGTMSINTSEYTWTVSPSSGVIFFNGSSAMSAKPYFKFSSISDYVITLSAKNPCGAESKTTVNIKTIGAESLGLYKQKDECNSLSYSPLPNNPKAEYFINGVKKTNFPIVLGLGKYKIVATLSNECGMQEKQDSFEVITPAAVSIISPSKDTSVCTNVGNVSFKPNISGGFFTVNNGGNISNQGVFSPNKAGVFTVTYTRGSGACATSATTKITVLEDEKFELPHQSDACNSLNYSPQKFNPKAIYKVNGIVANFPLKLDASATKYKITASLTGICKVQPLEDSFYVSVPQKIKIDANTPQKVCASAKGFFLKSSYVNTNWLLNGKTTSSNFNPSLAKIGQNIIIAEGNGCLIADTILIEIIDDKAQITAPSVLCFDDTDKTLSATPTGGIWSGNISANGIFSPKTLGNGIYKINYTFVVPNSACVAKDSVEIQVNQPSVGFSVSDCDDKTISFSSNFKNIVSVIWDFGDGTTSTSKASNVPHTYQNTGKYTVSVKGKIGNCEANFSQDITVEEKAFAAFSLPDTICENIKFDLKNLSSGSNLTYNWKLGNTVIGTSAAAPKDLVFSVLKDSSVTFSLELYNSCGKTTVSKTLKIRALPKANLGLLLPSYCSGEKFLLKNTSSDATNFVWKTTNFISKNPQIDSLILFTGKSQTTFTYQLIATNTCGSDSISKNISIKPTDVKAFFSINKKEICENEPLQIKSNATPNVPIKFLLGDGSISNKDSLAHPYLNAGKYTIIQYAYGCGFDSTKVEINVLPKPTLVLKTNQPVCLNTELKTEVITNGSNIRIEYTVTDTSNAFINSFLYKNSGAYPINVIAKSSNGCQTFLTKNVTIFSLPEVDFTIDASPCQYAPVKLQTDKKAVDYEYHSGNGNVADKSSATFFYNQPGVFKPYLILTDANGCKDSLVKQVLVKASPKADMEVQNNFACPPIDLKIKDLSQGATAYTYLVSDGKVSNNINPTFNFKVGGKYQVKQIVSNGICADTIEKNIYIKQVPVVSNEVKPITCFGKNDGIVLVNAGKTDFISLENKDKKYAQSGVNRYEPLSSGKYILAVKSLDDCYVYDTIKVFEPQELKISISTKDTIKLNLGGVDTLNILANFKNATYVWNTKQGFYKEFSSTSIGISPEENILYQLIAKDVNNCETNAQVYVKINKRFAVYIPNSFSPNDDGKNDNFTIFADTKDVVEIKSFRIFDKWGNQIFQRENFQPNIEAEGWNGSDYGSNIFVYQAIVVFKDGTALSYKGDILLVR